MKKVHVICLLAVYGLAGCNSGDAKHLGNDVSNLGKDTTAAASNATVVAKVGSVLSMWQGVNMSGLHLTAEGSTLTLGGHVANGKERKEIVFVAKHVRGVTKVIDNLRISP